MGLLVVAQRAHLLQPASGLKQQIDGASFSKSTAHCHAAMPTLAPEKVIADDREQLNLRVPPGFKEQLEELRRITGYRSVTAAVIAALQQTCDAKGI